jgi:hypothetical protein
MNSYPVFPRALGDLRGEKRLSLPHNMNPLPLDRRRRFFLMGRPVSGQFRVTRAAYDHIAGRAVFGGSIALPPEFAGRVMGVGLDCLA